MQRLKFLDGMRGWAAVIVVLGHVFSGGLPVDTKFSGYLKLLVPFNGWIAVCIFFVVSGFSLSIDFLTRGDLRTWMRTTIGRYFRLVIPIFLACLVVHFLMVVGFIAPLSERLPEFREFLTFSPTREHFIRFITYGVFFAHDLHDSYILPLWTMPYELAGSFIALFSALAFGNVRWRLIAFLAMAVLLTATSEYKPLAFFPLGCALAEYHVRGWSITAPLGFALLCAGFAIPLLVPYNATLWSQAAPLLIFGSMSVPVVRAFLENRLSCWLGTICFPLYLLHGPVIWVIGEPLTRNFGSGVAMKVAIDLAVIAASLIIARSFLWTEHLAIATARYIGTAGADAIMSRYQEETR